MSLSSMFHHASCKFPSQVGKFQIGSWQCAVSKLPVKFPAGQFAGTWNKKNLPARCINVRTISSSQFLLQFQVNFGNSTKRLSTSFVHQLLTSCFVMAETFPPSSSVSSVASGNSPSVVNLPGKTLVTSLPERPS